MRATSAFLLVLGAGLTAPPADAMLSEALSAKQIIVNAGLDGAFLVKAEFAPRPDRPAQAVYGTLFDFEGLIWMYSPETGTFVLGPSPPAGARYQEDLRARLVKLVPAAQTLVLYQQAAPVTDGELSQRPLKNSCVIGCLAALSRVLLRQGIPDEAGFVLFLFGSTGPFDPRNVSPLDHSIFVYRTAEGWFAIDPQELTRTLRLEHVAVGAPLDPLLQTLARRVGRALQHTYFFPIAPATLARLSARLDSTSVLRSKP